MTPSRLPIKIIATPMLLQITEQASEIFSAGLLVLLHWKASSFVPIHISPVMG